MRESGKNTAVILDRHPLWLDALERLLDTVGVVAVGKTTSAATALEMVETAHPRLFVAEYDSIEQSRDGLASLRRAADSTPDLQSVVLSTEEDSEQIGAAFAAGASVFCVQTAQPEDLVSAIRQAFHSSVYYAAGRPSRSETGAAPVPAVDLQGLTKREVEILQLVAEGYSNSQLARMLWVTEQTVKFHLSNVYRKLEVANRTEASRWAQLQGLLPPRAERSTAAA
jgi:DNA-binding NarL/FixJ family response regulator